MAYKYPSTKLDLMIRSYKSLTLGRNLAFSLCSQKSPFPCSQLGPVPTSVCGHETTSEVEGDDGICASAPHQREYPSKGKKKKLMIDRFYMHLHYFINSTVHEECQLM